MTADTVRELLRSHVKAFGSQRRFASALGVSPSFLNDILLGKREPSGKPLEYLNLRRVVTYEVQQRYSSEE